MCKNLILPFILIAFCKFTVYCQPTSGWQEEVNIYKQIYNAPITLINGEQTSIDKIAEKKPVIIALVYTRCTGICSPLLLQLKESLQLNKNNNNYTVLVVSFDSRDLVPDMRQMAHLFNLNNNSHWNFAITDSINQLISSIGFKPVWNNTIKQFDHDALLVGVNSQGYISKKLIGLRNEKELELMIGTINNVYTPTYRLPGQNTLFSCFNYNPITGKNKPGMGLLLIALPAILSIFLLVVINKFVHKKEEV